MYYPSTDPVSMTLSYASERAMCKKMARIAILMKAAIAC